MAFPFTIQVGSVALSLHLLCETLAFFLGYRYFRFLRGRQPDRISDDNRVWILIGAAGGALLGSRLLGALENPQLFFSGAGGWLYYYSAKTIVGGLLGGLFGVEAIKKAIGERHSSGDLFTYPLLLAMIIGRIGCLTAGVSEPTYGLPTDLPWAMDLGDMIPRHPTALYEIIFLIGLWGWLRWIEQRVRLRSGARFQLFMVAYLIYRFAIEFLRPGIAMPGLPIGLGLTAIQWACLLGLGYYYRVLLFPQKLTLPLGALKEIG
ncbi:prolipoprotein diacylglyceryl transferase [Catalinimonas alkaloidigena]|uniref:prolipoprotein diacylglyceryl transferase n=1 Tax=Catalinimonas alkaloidigena TaxID=1075417 RepID=UPI000B7D4A35|nr:prolipoprotein diacylglyceryl transferase family protein [Catalinimonas alkaloidigena]